MGNLKGVGLILASLLLLMSASLAHADDQAFVVKKIQLVGLQRISDGTVYDYLPVNIGDTMDPAHMEEMAKRLPHGRYLYCPDGSHMAMYDDQRTYFAGLVEFLRGL